MKNSTILPETNVLECNFVVEREGMLLGRPFADYMIVVKFRQAVEDIGQGWVSHQVFSVRMRDGEEPSEEYMRTVGDLYTNRQRGYCAFVTQDRGFLQYFDVGTGCD